MQNRATCINCSEACRWQCLLFPGVTEDCSAQRRSNSAAAQAQMASHLAMLAVVEAPGKAVLLPRTGRTRHSSSAHVRRHGRGTGHLKLKAPWVGGGGPVEVVAALPDAVGVPGTRTLIECAETASCPGHTALGPSRKSRGLVHCRCHTVCLGPGAAACPAGPVHKGP